MNMSKKPDTEPEDMPMEVLPPSAVESLQRGEIDIQIATAHRYPRSLALFKKRALEMVSLDEETAASCIYSRPVGKENGVMKYAEGMSVRLAEIVGACYGNLRVGSTVVEVTPRYVTTRGYAHDLESNFASASEVVEATVDKRGNPYSERMRIVAAKACLAKSRRDATFVVVPKALCKPLEEKARAVAIGNAATLAKRRGAVMAWVNKLGIGVERVFAALGVKGEEDMGVDHLTILTGLKTAIKDGEVTVDEAFPSRYEAASSVPNFSAESAPEITQPGGGEKTEASSGTQTDPAGASGDGEANVTGKPASAAPGDASKQDDLGWPPEENA